MPATDSPRSAVRNPGGQLPPPQLGNPVIVNREVPDRAIGQGEDPLRHPQRHRERLHPRAEVRHLQLDRVVGLKAHIDQHRSLQRPPAIAFACLRQQPPDGPVHGSHQEPRGRPHAYHRRHGCAALVLSLHVTTARARPGSGATSRSIVSPAYGVSRCAGIGAGRSAVGGVAAQIRGGSAIFDHLAVGFVGLCRLGKCLGRRPGHLIGAPPSTAAGAPRDQEVIVQRL